MPDELRKQLTAAKVGDVRLFTEGEQSYVVRVSDVTPESQKPFDEVKADIQEKLFFEKVNAAIADWAAQAAEGPAGQGVHHEDRLTRNRRGNAVITKTRWWLLLSVALVAVAGAPGQRRGGAEVLQAEGLPRVPQEVRREVRLGEGTSTAR